MKEEMTWDEILEEANKETAACMRDVYWTKFFYYLTIISGAIFSILFLYSIFFSMNILIGIGYGLLSLLMMVLISWYHSIFESYAEILAIYERIAETALRMKEEEKLHNI